MHKLIIDKYNCHNFQIDLEYIDIQNISEYWKHLEQFRGNF